MSDYCAEQVRKLDYPHYVITLFAPVGKRPVLWALYAFNSELARIRSLIKEPMMGLIRLQWWRDTIEKLYNGEVLRHEVIQELNLLLKQIPWQKQEFLQMIDAYEEDLQLQSYASEQEFWSHAERMGRPLLKMASQVYGNSLPEPLIKILGSCEYALRFLNQDPRCIGLNKKSIMNEVIQKLNLVDLRILKKSPAFFSYNFTKWQLKYLRKNKVRNDFLLGFYLWRKSFGL